MKRTILILTLIVATTRCATNPDVLDSSKILGTQLDTYAADIGAKAKEQRELYDNRARHLAEARAHMIDKGIDQVLVTNSIAEASRMASDPDSVRPAAIIDFLLDTHAAEKGRDAELRGAAAGAESSLRGSIASLDEKKKEIKAVQESIKKLSRRPKTKAEVESLAQFGKAVADDLKEKQKSKQKE